MKQMKQWMHWVLALVLLVMSLSVPAAAAETITVNVTNTPVRGSVALEKTGLQLVRFTDEQDEWGNTVMKPVYQQGYLKGAVFELRAAADVVGKEGTVFYKQGELVETLTTSADGAVNSKLLPLGSYCLQEVSAPDGYLLDDTPYPFTLTAAGRQTPVVEVKVSAVNTYLPIRVTLHKQQEAIRVDETADGMIRSSIETVPGEGCVFGLFNAGVISYGDSQKLPAHTLMATGITDAKGNLTFSGMYPHGAYYVKELSAPDGWLLNTEQYPVQLTPENMDAAEEAIAITLDAPILNRLIYTPVTITKRDVAGKETLPGALIEVYDAQGSTIYRAYTDENGQLPDIPLVPGSYTFKETYAPEGYALNVAVKTFTVTSEGKIIGETEIRDEINKIQLKKVKENGGADRADFFAFGGGKAIEGIDVRSADFADGRDVGSRFARCRFSCGRKLFDGCGPVLCVRIGGAAVVFPDVVSGFGNGLIVQFVHDGSPQYDIKVEFYLFKIGKKY